MKQRGMMSKFLFSLCILGLASATHAQTSLLAGTLNKSSSNEVLDEVIGIVGQNIILKSEHEAQKIQAITSGYDLDGNTRCVILEDLLFSKLLLNQSRLDSLEVTEGQIQAELERRLRFFIAQIGSEEKLEEYYQKSIAEIKDDFHDAVKEQLYIQMMQQKITADIKITPAEVREYFNSIPKDSLPYMNAEIKVAQIVIKPPISDKEAERIKNELNGIKKELEDGADFAAKAIINSDDQGSAIKGGKLGFMKRDQLVPEFSAAAFKLKPGEISDIVETEYGYHIIQLIERRGESINCRHILMTPKVSTEDLEKSKSTLDSIYNLITTVDSLTFEWAAEKFSTDEESKLNGGLIVNPQTGTTSFETELLGQIDPDLFFQLDKMQVEQISEPILWRMPDGNFAYRIVKLVERTEPHQANLKDDYQKIQEVALSLKQNEELKNWINRTINNTFIRINEEFLDCEFENKWVTSIEN
ncbi:MAG: peptidylprolyl isomerase [Flavobacteriales bacterium]|nr:peptidylprolyl isomerase [Flavobacteriales bacterium]